VKRKRGRPVFYGANNNVASISAAFGEGKEGAIFVEKWLDPTPPRSITRGRRLTLWRSITFYGGHS